MTTHNQINTLKYFVLCFLLILSSHAVALNLIDSYQIDGLPSANSILISPDDRFVYVTSRYDDALAVFQRNVETGQLNLIQVLKNGNDGIDGLDGVMSIAISPDNQYLYAVSCWFEQQSTFVVFQRDLNSGELTFIPPLFREGDKHGTFSPGMCSVMVSSDNQNVYVGDYPFGGITIFKRESDTGQLTVVQIKEDALEVGINELFFPLMAISPNNRHVYVSFYDQTGTNAAGGVVFYTRDLGLAN